MKFVTTADELDLTGQWSFAFTGEEPKEPPLSTADLKRLGLTVHPCAVPGNFELDLHANGLLPDPFFGMNIARLRELEDHHIYYFRTFRADASDERQAELVFEGLDCFAEVYLNGQSVGESRNMLVEQVFPITGRLGNENELLVHISPVMAEARKHIYPTGALAMPANYESLYVRKAPHMFGWDIMPRALSAGIWRPVRIRRTNDVCISTVYLETLDIRRDSAALRLHYSFRSPAWRSDTYEIEISGECGASRFHERRRVLFNSGRVDFAVETPALWWPRGRGEATLYGVRVRLFRNGAEADSVSFRHGIRTVELERTSLTDAEGSGEFCFRVNGERVFVKGSNWVPADAFHSRDRNRIPRMLEMAADLDCNMLRCWGGNVYEDDLFYDTCDELGIMVWQDFAMACAVYPQDAAMQEMLRHEAEMVVRRLRQHPCLVLWAGDNECDCSWVWGGVKRDPNANVLTREVLPRVLQMEDPGRPYLPSSPLIDAEAFLTDPAMIPENHLWGPRDYYKGEFYQKSVCHFASEIGYHGCPSPESLREFLSPEKLWPYEGNEEWLLHCTSPVPGCDLFDYRVELMAKQVRAVFGEAPDNLDDYAFASQAVQAEAKKFFIEMFRAAKWRRTGIIWWNLIDGWPQFSDAVVDYYFRPKLAYSFIRRAQRRVALVLREPESDRQELVACNDLREAVDVRFSVEDVQSGEVLASGTGQCPGDAVAGLASIPYDPAKQTLYAIRWRDVLGDGTSHYLAGTPPFRLEDYRSWLNTAGLLRH